MKPRQPASVSGFFAAFFVPASRCEDGGTDLRTSSKTTEQLLAEVDHTIEKSTRLRAQGAKAIARGETNFRAIDSEIAASTAIRGTTC